MRAARQSVLKTPLQGNSPALAAIFHHTATFLKNRVFPDQPRARFDRCLGDKLFNLSEGIACLTKLPKRDPMALFIERVGSAAHVRPECHDHPPIPPELEA